MKTTRIQTFLGAIIMVAVIFTSTIRAAESGPEFLNDYEKAVAAAAESGIPAIVIFSASWCPPCQQMNKAVYPSETVQPYHERFVWAYLDADDPKNGPVSAKFGVAGIPHIAFLQPDGEPIGYFAGAISPDQFVEVLEKVLEAKDDPGQEESTEVSAVTE